MKVFRAPLMLAMLFAPIVGYAGNSTGKIGQILVGRAGTQVFIELQSAQFNGWPCSTTHTSGFRFAFLLTRSGAKELLASVLAAQTTGRNVQIVGTGECTIDPSLEDLSYVVLMP